MAENYHLRCVNCQKEYEKDEVQYTCPDCGNRLGTLEVVYDFKEKKWIDEAHTGIWRFLPILPVRETDIDEHLKIGDTPLYRSETLAGELGLSSLLIKDDGKNPTASFKDRASAVAVAKAHELGYSDIYAASTGNAASSLSGVCAGTGVKAHIFVPQNAPEAKVVQQLIYGAEVFSIQGNYDQAFDLSLKKGEEKGWYCRNSAVNPYLLEGKKTCALEMAWQTGLKLPDYIFVSVGDGTVYSSFIKGFSDLKQIGVIEKIPTVIGVQAAGCAAIKQAFDNGRPFKPDDIVNGDSEADSIAVGKPRDVIKACQYAFETGGFFMTVSDQAIGQAVIELARKTGVFAEPAGAASYAGIKKAIQERRIEKNKTAAIIITGNGLKDIKTPVKYLSEAPQKIYPD